MQSAVAAHAGSECNPDNPEKGGGCVIGACAALDHRKKVWHADLAFRPVTVKETQKEMQYEEDFSA